jgi:enoyl-CoA hydratase/carnithine racemase
MNDMTRHIAVATADHVATVVIDRAPHNHVNARLVEALADTFEALDRDDDVRAIVLATEGKVFCGGADLGRARRQRSTPPPSGCSPRRSRSSSRFRVPRSAPGWAWRWLGISASPHRKRASPPIS